KDRKNSLPILSMPIDKPCLVVLYYFPFLVAHSAVKPGI
ncbi:hypothetical protein BMETH_175011192345, partial [methanotrophic bacterial endosymbiont of Bathymodiolus sp.]